jgi:hypothetical protein
MDDGGPRRKVEGGPAERAAMKGWLRLASVGVALTLLAGCLGGPKEPAGPAAASSTDSATSAPSASSTAGPLSPDPRPDAPGPSPEQRPTTGVVIADVSPGTNPYHVAHRRPTWTDPPWLRVPAMPELPALRLTFTGDLEADLAADEEAWAAYEPGVVHWVPGTNLLLLTLEAYPGQPSGHNVRSTHGIATAGAVSEACPGCYVLVVQDWGGIDGQAMQHIADRLPWVDLAVSTSFGFNNVEYAGAAAEEGYAAGTRALWDRGGLAFGPTGNGLVTPNAQYLGPTFSMHFVSLPPWVVMVGGSESACNAVPPAASKPPEFVSDYTQALPSAGNETSRALVGGTSFSTPKAAGLFGQALSRVRQALPGTVADGALWKGEPGPGPWLADGALTNAELREAMAQAAVHFATADYVAPPGCPLSPPHRVTIDPPPAPASATPWTEMGWGHLGPEQAGLAADRILAGAAPARDPATVAWMGALAEARAAAYPW